jgi:hypothetical protein
MNGRRRNFLNWIAGGIVLLSGGLGWSADAGFEKYTALIRRDPFVSKTGGASSVVRSSATSSYRFTGLIVIGTKTLVGIENVAGNRSYLLNVGQETDGLVVKEVEAKEKRAVLMANGEMMTLSLVDASMALPAGAPAAAAAAVPSASVSSPPVSIATAGSITNQTSAITRRRIIVPKRN